MRRNFDAARGTGDVVLKIVSIQSFGEKEFRFEAMDTATLKKLVVSIQSFGEKEFR